VLEQAIPLSTRGAHQNIYIAESPNTYCIF